MSMFNEAMQKLMGNIFHYYARHIWFINNEDIGKYFIWFLIGNIIQLPWYNVNRSVMSLWNTFVLALMASKCEKAGGLSWRTLNCC